MQPRVLLVASLLALLACAREYPEGLGGRPRDLQAAGKWLGV